MAIVDAAFSDETPPRLVAARVDYIQLRDHNCSAAKLLRAAHRLRDLTSSSSTRILINSRPDIALAAHADGVHLRSHPGAFTPRDVRTLFAHHDKPAPIISISCHTLEDIARARTESADLALFGPIFEKPLPTGHTLPGIGLDHLAKACALAGTLPILALGGITQNNTPACLNAGASGIASIRLFNSNQYPVQQDR